GVGKDFDHERFEKFLTEGSTPKITEEGYNSGVVLSEKIAQDPHLKTKDSIVAVFSRGEDRIIYRKFEVSGIYKTDINMIDDQFIIGDINHVRRMLDMEKDAVGGIDVLLKNVNDIDKDPPEIEALV